MDRWIESWQIAALAAAALLAALALAPAAMPLLFDSPAPEDAEFGVACTTTENDGLVLDVTYDGGWGTIDREKVDRIDVRLSTRTAPDRRFPLPVEPGTTRRVDLQADEFPTVVVVRATMPDGETRRLATFEDAC